MSMNQAPETPNDGFQKGDTHEEFAESTVDDRELAKNNFGAGVYSKGELYEQTERFKRTINANAGIGEDIRKRAMGEAWLTIARKGWTIRLQDQQVVFPSLDDAKGNEPYDQFAKQAREVADDRRDQEIAYARLVWDDMDQNEQEYALAELSSLDESFDPPEFRVAKFFHESSRSKGGRLMDNVFGRVRKMIQENTQEGGSGFFGGSR